MSVEKAKFDGERKRVVFPTPTLSSGQLCSFVLLNTHTHTHIAAFAIA